MNQICTTNTRTSLWEHIEKVITIRKALEETADDLEDVLKFQDELKCVNTILKTSRDKLEEPPL